MTDRLRHREPAPEVLGQYLRRVPGMPPLDTQKLNVQLLQGSERDQLVTPTTGDASLVVTYKKREGSVASFGLTEEELEILQLQGARPEGFRVNTGLQVVRFFADQIEGIATDPENGLARVTMPPIVAIKGMVDATEAALGNYQELAARLHMRFSDEEGRYVKDVK